MSRRSDAEVLQELGYSPIPPRSPTPSSWEHHIATMWPESEAAKKVARHALKKQNKGGTRNKKPRSEVSAGVPSVKKPPKKQSEVMIWAHFLFSAPPPGQGRSRAKPRPGALRQSGATRHAASRSHIAELGSGCSSRFQETSQQPRHKTAHMPSKTKKQQQQEVADDLLLQEHDLKKKLIAQATRAATRADAARLTWQSWEAAAPAGVTEPHTFLSKEALDAWWFHSIQAARVHQHSYTPPARSATCADRAPGSCQQLFRTTASMC